MKKGFGLLVAIACCMMGLCSLAYAEEPAVIRVAALKGPTAMGMVKLMADTDASDSPEYEFRIVGAVDEVTALVAKGEVDVAALPANLAAVLYQNLEKNVSTLCVNTLGVLYILSHSDEPLSVKDLMGKKLYASGKGATPEYALNYILTGNGLNPGTDLDIEWKSEHTECLAAFLADEESLAMLPQPFVTVAETQNENIYTVLSLSEEWDKLQEESETPSAMITGVAVVRKNFAEEHPDELEGFMDKYADSVAFVQENPEEAAALIGGYDIVPEPVALKALPYCEITLIEGSEMKGILSGYLHVLYEQNPASVGNNMPEDDFYYGAN